MNYGQYSQRRQGSGRRLCRRLQVWRQDIENQGIVEVGVKVKVIAVGLLLLALNGRRRRQRLWEQGGEFVAIVRRHGIGSKARA